MMAPDNQIRTFQGRAVIAANPGQCQKCGHQVVSVLAHDSPVGRSWKPADIDAQQYVPHVCPETPSVTPIFRGRSGPSYELGRR